MEKQNILEEVAVVLEIIPRNNAGLKKKVFIARVNELLEKDFNKLVAILYRMDVDENRLRLLLDQNKDSDAAIIITELIIERQIQRLKSREAFRNNENEIDEEEKW